MGAAYEGLRVDASGDRLVITLDRPEVRNAIDTAMADSLHLVCAQLERDPRPAIFTGGPNIFAAGADIAELRQRGRLEALTGTNSGLFDRISRLPMPTVAAVAGPAIGGGAELAYARDFRIGTPPGHGAGTARCGAGTDGGRDLPSLEAVDEAVSQPRSSSPSR